MDYKRNELFFNSKRIKIWTYVTYVSYAFIAAAVLIFIFNGAGMGRGGSWALATALPAAVVGVALLLTAINMMTSEKQIKEQIAILQTKAREESRSHFNFPDENPDLFFAFEGYNRTNPELTFRKKKNGRIFTTEYVITYMMIENKTLRIWQKATSLTEEKETLLTKDIPLVDLHGAELVSETVKRTANDGTEKEVPIIAVRVLDAEKNLICTANCKIYDYDMERFAETLSHGIKRAKQ